MTDDSQPGLSVYACWGSETQELTSYIMMQNQDLEFEGLSNWNWSRELE